ncbi:MAG: ubiquitin-like protein UBact [Armatimonadota bacterium]
MFPIKGEERIQRPGGPAEPFTKPADDSGPKPPDVKRPDPSDLLKRMRRVDPEQAKRYRQRSGE